ncbi:odorant receptor 13a-like [Odontomachus brunneus]|uniref:odorant receptor 13a-like n=1 Tax=Odontomachus brunneus TaxID=486640 RepID=UPI0013F2725D|nr:odorant receptor 13a-like [Odontomachus brunneus]
MKQDDNIYINAYPRHEDDENYRIISNSVAKHVKVLQFAKLFASTYSISLFIMTLLNTVFIAFSGIQVVINMDRPLEALRFTVAGLCLVLHFLFLSLPGQKLIDHSSKVHESIYAAKWYAISVRARKLLNLMLMRSKIPCQISAWMCVMSLQNFNTVIQASMSYFTLITSMR